VNKLKHLIAGPCSAETEKQVLDTAKQISKIKEVSLFRAGVWKPRTSPNSFDGVGDIGLSWLQRVKQEYNLKVITEVATPWHVEKCLLHNIDAIWIGTRTTVNPFYVQEIANSLKGVDIPVYVKNPITPDLALWCGAIERFENAGIKHINAIHRGFYTYESFQYRNEPIWELPKRFKEEYPNIDLICDPSHIAGSRNLIDEVSKMAMLNNMQGLMVETHLDPNNALSDKNQQITPSELISLINKFKNTDYNSSNNFLKLKKELSHLEEGVLGALVKRYQFVKELATLRDDKLIPNNEISKWKKMLKEFKNDSKELDLEQSFINKIMSIILNES
jgi:chorismate mutase